MKVFLSWSGTSSNRAAKGLRILLKDVLQVEPFVSSEDIGKGLPWHRELTRQLTESRYAIICLTRDNLKAPWLNFEAGAISNAIEQGLVCPYLLDLQPAEISNSPLGSIQTCYADEEDTFKLISDLNRCLGGDALKDEDLRRKFARVWPEFEEILTSLRTPARRNNDIFVSTPITSLPNSVDFDVLRVEVISAIEHLREKFGKESVYSSILRIKKSDKPEPPSIAFQRDIKALRDAEKLILFYPSVVPTSCFFEAGYALAMGKPAVYFVKKDVKLPFAMEGAASIEKSLVRKLEYRDIEELTSFIDDLSDFIFPTSE